MSFGFFRPRSLRGVQEYEEAGSPFSVFWILRGTLSSATLTTTLQLSVSFGFFNDSRPSSDSSRYCGPTTFSVFWILHSSSMSNLFIANIPVAFSVFWILRSIEHSRPSLWASVSGPSFSVFWILLMVISATAGASPVLIMYFQCLLDSSRLSYRTSVFSTRWPYCDFQCLLDSSYPV